jgi:hypothetical protein
MDTLYGQGRFGAGVSVALYELEPYSSSDISTFDSCYGISPTIHNYYVDGASGNGAGSGEAALDIEQVASLAPKATIDVYQGINGTDAQILDVYAQIANADTAQVVSTSWGLCEADSSPALLSAEGTVFAQMAAQGQSVFAASGDAGSEGCYYPSQGLLNTSLAAVDPGSQPDVTSVGGTTLGGGSGETTWNNCLGLGSGCAAMGGVGASGGGVSTTWSRPAWQTGLGVVGSMRETPDVSASADPQHGSLVFWNGYWLSIGGTSAAAPLWGALSALSDQGCASPIGQVDPKLYAIGESGFSDISSGNNDFTASHGGTYPAGVGYDLATGLGSPNAPALLKGLQLSAGCPSISAVSPSSGPISGGTKVTISGSDLAGASAVSFGGVAASSFSYNSATQQITAVAPAVAVQSTVVISVAGPGGTSADAGLGEFTYTGTIAGGAPGAPSAVVAVTADSAASLNWNPPTDSGGGAVSGYVVTASDGTSQLTGPSTGYSYGGLTNGVSYTFSVAAVNAYGTGPAATSNPVTPQAAARIPGAPGPVVATGGVGSASLSWTAPGSDGGSAILGYTVTPSSGVGVYVGDQLNYDYQGLTNGLIYTFSVAAINKYGTGPSTISNPVIPHSAVPLPGAPTALTAAARNRAALVTWRPPLGSSVSGYVISPSVGTATLVSAERTSYLFTGLTNGTAYTFSVAAIGLYGVGLTSGPSNAVTPTAPPNGYWLVASDGGIFSFGDAAFYGSTGAMVLNKPVVGMATTPDGRGYWLVASDGGIFSFGDAAFYGSTGAMALNKPIAGMAASPDGGGYWLVASDGGIFSFGDASWQGSPTGAGGVSTIAPTFDGGGYWVSDARGDVFAFGDAVAAGSMSGKPLSRPVVAMAAGPEGGYWLVASDGGIFSFGGALFYGSTGAMVLNKPIVGMAPPG